jgi:hypothetical protein
MAKSLSVLAPVHIHQELDSLMRELELHRVYQNDYFRLLKKANWSKESYALHRANFFYRTELTVKSIAQVCARASAEDDVATLTLFSYILNEETGNGQLKNCHALLMEKSHNLFGQVVFGLEPLAVVKAKNSPLIIAGTVKYRQRIAELASGSYQRLLGVAMALESHAEKMLTQFRDAFRVYAGQFHGEQFVREVEVYFNVHLNGGVEERHASDARQCVAGNCQTVEDLSEIAYGAHQTLEVQAEMWADMYRQMIHLP